MKKYIIYRYKCKYGLYKIKNNDFTRNYWVQSDIIKNIQHKQRVGDTVHAAILEKFRNIPQQQF